MLRIALPAADCNRNGVEDADDISAALSRDCNDNRVPDECEGATLPFMTVSSFLLPRAGEDVVIDDFNGDGRADIVVGYRDGLTAVLSRGGAALGDYTTRQQPVPGRGRVWRGADLDGDGDVDLIAIDTRGLSIHFNLEHGTFGQTRSIEIVSGLSDLALGDLDDDSDIDIALVDSTSNVVMLLMNRGTGDFASPVTYTSGDSPRGIALEDVEGDGDVDVVVASRDSNELLLLPNRGAGVLDAQVVLSTVGAGPELVAIADFDADGRFDFAVGHADGVSILFREDDSDRTREVQVSNEYRRASALQLADIDTDGDTDLIAAFRAPQKTVVIVNQGDGTFVRASFLGEDVVARQFGTADFDADGDEDIAVLSAAHNNVNILWNDEIRGGGLLRMRNAGRVEMGGEPHHAELADVDGDLDLDIVANDGGNHIFVLRNHGDGTFSPPATFSAGTASGLFSLEVADFDLDGDLDVVAVSDSDSQAHVLLGDGTGVFEWDASYSVASGPFYLHHADLSGDGRADLVVACAGAGALTFLFNEGAGRFARRETIRVGSRPTSVASADFDRNGATDLVVSNHSSSTVSMLLNRGDGTFQSAANYDVRSPQFVTTLDFDDDGFVDVAAVNELPRKLSLWRNDGRAFLNLALEIDLSVAPYSLLTGDINRDGLTDIVVASQRHDALAAIVGNGDGGLLPALELQVGDDPRFAMAGDLDGDGDVDLLSANHTSQDFDVILNEAVTVAERTFLERVCTPLEFQELSIPVVRHDVRRRLSKYIVPATEQDSESLPPLFQNVNVYRLHQDFLAAEFSDRFAVEAYDELVGNRATRRYFSGNLYRLRTSFGPLYGFSVLTNFDADRRELPTIDEVRGVEARLRQVFSLRPLLYYPDAALTREDASGWPDQSLVFLDEPPSVAGFVPYTTGLAYGRVRLISEREFAALNGGGRLSFQDIVVLDFAPRDIEGIVAAVVTATPQGELSHLAVRSARRGTPNVFVENAHDLFSEFEDRLVRLEVGTGDWSIDAASLSEAAEFWAANRPQLSELPTVDEDYSTLDRFEEMALEPGSRPVSRYGGKAANLARLQSVLSGPLQRYQEVGFAIPMSYYLEFLRANRMPSARDSERQVTYEEFLQELLDWAEFQSDSELRFDVLRRFRDTLRAQGVVAPDVVARVAARIREVFRADNIPVRFRSSSNVEDVLEFNGAGLYDSTSACVLDTVDADDVGPSHCDFTQASERTIERALKKVWASNWNYRAYEERAFFGIPQELSTMGVLVNRAFLNERANGVAFTGDPNRPEDSRYVVIVQAGEESVVSPSPGVLAEKNLLRVEEGELVEIVRASPSNLIGAGEFVLSDVQLAELGRLLWHVDRHFPIDADDVPRRQVLLDIEFKIEANGELALKQVRPFLRSTPPLPTPTFALEIPRGANVCGVFVTSRSPRTTYELKSRIRFVPGTIPLPTTSDSWSADLFEEVTIGPDRTSVEPLSPGRFRVVRTHRGELTSYSFRYEQTYVLPGGDTYELALQDLEFEARGDEPLAVSRIMDEAFFTRALSLHGQHSLDVTYSSCTYETLPLWEVDIEAADGSILQLRERHEPAPPSELSGPASLVSAELSLRGAERDVVAYEDLIYTAKRHNRSVEYWVVLRPSLRIHDLPSPVRVVEIVAPEAELGIQAVVRYLDENFEVLDSISVERYERLRVSGEVLTRFERGDVNASGDINLSDAIRLIDHLFRGRGAAPCWKAADADDDGEVDLSDVMTILRHLFDGAQVLAPPHGKCGSDPTADNLTCRASAGCET